MIRHASLLHPAPPVLPLPVAVVQPSFRTVLVSAVGASPLTDSGLFPAGDAAVALAAVATRAKEENSAAFAGQAKPLPQNYFVERRHPSSQREGWTTVVASCQVRTSLLVVTLRRSPKRNPVAPTTGFPLASPPSMPTLHCWRC